MRTTLVKLGLTALLAVWLGSLGGSLRADTPETFEPGTGKYILVLKDPRTDADDPATGKKKAKEPDLAKHGGKVLKKKDAVRVIKLPNKAAKALRKEENVAYVQRVWVGESQDNWGEDELTSSLVAEADPELETLDTDLTWTTGQYLYDGSGNIKQIGSDTYRYDSAGRLIQASVKGITETYKYDAFGNLTEKAISGVPLVNQVDPSSNRLKGEVYDAAGNLTTRAGAPRYQYDSLSMMDAITKPLQTNRFLYGPDDERIAVIVEEGSLSRWKFRDFSGKVLREFKSDDYFGVWEWTEDYVNGEGKVLAAERESYFGGKRHFHTDHLGTVRMITDQNRMRLSVHDFYPFGVEQTDATQEYNRLAGTYGSGDFRSEPMKFTGHERDWHGWLNVDNDDYLDYMHARYYDPNLGRFLSIDPGPVDAAQPQTWNRYSYALNSPLKYVDPTGEVVNLAGLTAEERNALLLSLNSVSGNEYGTNNNGDLTVINYGQNASATATQFLDDAIVATNVYTVNAINNSSAVNSMNSYQATGAINIDFADFRNTNNSGLSSESFGLGSNLLHELVHVHKMWNDPPAAGTPGVPAAQDAKHSTGPVVDFVNQIHRERGLPQRGPSYAPQNTERTIGGRVRVPFIDPQTGRMVYVWPKLRP